MYSCNYKNEYLGEGGFPDAFRGVHVKFPLAKKTKLEQKIAMAYF